MRGVTAEREPLDVGAWKSGGRLPREAGKAARNLALDFTKGALVLFMVLYHTMNYFMENRGGAWLKYLRFLPPSFIFITGFLISNVYLTRYGSGDARLYRRLIVRGLKLVMIFTLLNLLAGLVTMQTYNGKVVGLAAFIRNIDRKSVV